MWVPGADCLHISWTNSLAYANVRLLICNISNEGKICLCATLLYSLNSAAQLRLIFGLFSVIHRLWGTNMNKTDVNFILVILHWQATLTAFHAFGYCFVFHSHELTKLPTLLGHGCLRQCCDFGTLAALLGKRNVTVWRPSVSPSVCLFRRHTHRDSPRAACDAASIHFRSSNKEDLFIVYCLFSLAL